MFYVTYDSHDCGGVFKVHKSKGIIKFLPTPKDLHALHLKDNPNSALVNDTWIGIWVPSRHGLPEFQGRLVLILAGSFFYI